MKKKSKGVYVSHLNKMEQKIKLNMKKEVAWAIILTSAFWLFFFLGINL